MMFFKAVNRCLINKGYGECRSQVMKRNVIDISDFTDEKDIEIDNRVKETGPGLYSGWLTIMPPFEHGTLILDKDTYITWDLEGVDLEKKEMRIFCYRHYFRELPRSDRQQSHIYRYHLRIKKEDKKKGYNDAYWNGRNERAYHKCHRPLCAFFLHFFTSFPWISWDLPK